MLGDKLITSLEEFSKGTSIRKILFSSNPGIFPFPVAISAKTPVYYITPFGYTTTYPSSSNYPKEYLRVITKQKGYTMKKPTLAESQALSRALYPQYFKKK